MKAWMSLCLLVLATSVSALSAQRSGRAEPWSGWAQCRLDVQGPGYSNRQVHTWTITGLAPPGGIEDYPGTWTVTGEGRLDAAPNRPSSASWTTKGSAPGLRIGIFVRASDNRLLVLLRHGQLNVPDGTIVSQQLAGPAVARASARPLSQAIYEWRPFPAIEDTSTATRLNGSAIVPLTGRLDAFQPADATGKAECSWDFARGAVASPPPDASTPVAATVTPAGAATGTPVRPAITRPGASAERIVVPVMPATRTITLSGFIAAGTAVAVAPRTIPLAGFTAAGTAALVAPRTIALSGFTASGTAAPVPPRTIPLTGWTGAGPEPAAGRGRQR